MAVVPEVLGDGECGVAHPQAGTRLLLHLPEAQHRLPEDIGLLELSVQLLGLSTPFTDSAEEAHSLVTLRHVVDQLHDQDRFADSGSPEEPGLSTPLERREQVECLDSGLEDAVAGRSMS